MLRQGDILIQSIEAVPDGAQKLETEGSRFVLFEGEATGHAHTLHMEESDMLDPTPSVYQLANREGELIFEITSVASLQHEEHGSLMLEPGVYCARRQREFSWGGFPYVED
ncbi:hypothetical protein ACFL34_00525 [Candidatus Sumerlaeota bacterium]